MLQLTEHEMAGAWEKPMVVEVEMDVMSKETQGK